MIDQHIESAADFVTLLQRWEFTGCYFRGVRDSRHALISSLGRFYRRGLDVIEGGKGALLRQEQSSLAAFKNEAVAHLSTLPQHDLEWLALAQHHGCPTRLLDFTRSPLTALYFALEPTPVAERGPSEMDGAVYVWCPDQLTVLRADNSAHMDAFRLNELCAYLPPRSSRRVGAQGSIFAVIPAPWEPMDDEEVARVTIPGELKQSLRQFLAQLGVGALSLFPDLDGVGRHIRTRIFESAWEGSA